jgi:membrane protein YqaA with SNARE-associated domain
VATLFDIAVGYYIGTILHKKSDQIRLIKYLKKKFDALTDFMGKKGKVLTLLLFVPILFPISAIFLPWFEMPFIEVAAYTFLGELVFWYGYEWLLVLGVKSFANDSHFALYAVLCISLALSIVLKIIWKKVEKGKKKSFLTKE